MTNISKCLAVFVTVASLAFLGVVSVSAVGGPNYETELADKALSIFRWDKSYDEASGKVTYSAETRRKLPDPDNRAAKHTAKGIGKDEKVLPKLLINAHKYVQQQQTKRNTRLDAKIALRKLQLGHFQDDPDGRKAARDLVIRELRIDPQQDILVTINKDRKALDDRIRDLKVELKRRRDDLAALQKTVAETQGQAFKKREKANRRRDDVERIRHQIDELIADIYRLETQRGKLRVRIEAMKGTILRQERRNRQLKQQLAKKKQ